MKQIVNLYRLGRLPYVKALNVQRVLFDKLKNDVTKNSPTSCITGDIEQATSRNSLILVEHDPVYTIGLRSSSYDEVYFEKLKEKLREHKLDASFAKTSRGGLITFHGPGQLVAYPIIYLGDFQQSIRNKSVKSYVNLLEKTIIDTLDRVGISNAHTLREYPGVWVHNGQRKVAFIGISCKRYVTMHGISINCDCDLSWFDHIISCGIEDRLVTSIQQELLFKRHSELVPNIESTCGLKSSASFRNNTISKQLHNSNYSASVENISQAFCLSFSQKFHCNLTEKKTFDSDEMYRHLDVGNQ